MWAAKAKTSLRIRAVWSGHSMSTNRIVTELLPAVEYNDVY